MSERLFAIERIKSEIEFISNYPFRNIGINIELPSDDNMFEWKGFLIGPDDTPYKAGIFYFKILFPQNYPKQLSRIHFYNSYIPCKCKLYRSTYFPIRTCFCLVLGFLG